MGKRIVLLHGWSARAEKLENLRLELEKLGWKVLNLDMPGFGLMAPREAWGVGEYTNWVTEQINKKWKKGTYVVFGHSFGGRLTIKMAAQGRVYKAVICCPGGLSRPNIIKRWLFELLAKTGKFFRLNKYRWLLYKLAQEHDYEKTDDVMKQVFKKVIAEDLNPLLEKINIPTLVLWGKQDKVVSYTDAAKFKNAKIILFDNQGHRLPYDAPNDLAKAIDQWNNTL